MRVCTFPLKGMSNLILFDKDLDKEIVVVAELGVNHGGSIAWIMDMLPRLKEAGADAVKFQLFTPDLYASRSNETRRKFLESVFLTKDAFLKIMGFAESIKLPIFATPVSHDWVEFIAEVCGVVKVASGDFSFQPTIQAALESEAKVIASTGATSLDELLDFLQIAKSIRPDFTNSVCLLHCVSAYPPPLNQANMRAIPFMKDLTKLTIGFSSHFLENAPLYAALALGARIFEIHVTDDRNRLEIRDHKLSRTPDELSSIVNTLHSLDESMLEKDKRIQPSELEIISSLKKGVVYARSLPAGHFLELSDLSYARPLNKKIPNFDSVVGKQLNKPVLAFHSVEESDLT